MATKSKVSIEEAKKKKKRRKKEGKKNRRMHREQEKIKRRKQRNAENEKIILREVGRAIQASNIPREQIFITTKLWVKGFNPKSAAAEKKASGAEEAKLHPAYQYAMTRAEESLANLGTYIDLYLLHSPHYPTARGPMWRALEDLKSRHFRILCLD